MSGNKLLWFGLLVLAVFLSSCAALRKRETVEVVTPPSRTEPRKPDADSIHVVTIPSEKPVKQETGPPIPGKETPPEKPRETPKAPETPKQEERPAEPEKKIEVKPKTEATGKTASAPVFDAVRRKQWRIGLILPFYSGKNAGESDPLYDKSQFAVDFYRGFQLGIKSPDLQERILVSVLDEKREENRVEELVARDSLRFFDVLVGPASTRALASLTGKLAVQRTVLFSPFNPTHAGFEQEPFFFQCVAGLEDHAALLCRQLKSMDEGQPIFLINQQAELARNQLFRQELTQQLGVAPSRIVDITIPNGYESLNAYILDSTLFREKNLVIIPSWNENFVEHALRKLIHFSELYSFTVFGMPQWKNLYRSLDLDLLNRLQVYITASRYAAEDAPDWEIVRKRYFESYTDIPTEDALAGYDLGKYLAESIRAYAKSGYFPAVDTVHPGLVSDFRFEPDRLRSNQCFINKGLKILLYDGSDFVPVPSP